MTTYKNKSDIKVAVIGYGGQFNMGRSHLTACREAGMTPNAVADLDEKRLAIAESDFPGLETYDSVAKFLQSSKANLVIVVTPHNTHAKLAIECAKAGKHVVVEKPFAITTSECDSMIATSAKNKVLLSTYHNRHWDGCILAAMKSIGSGAIGNIVRVDAKSGGWGKPRDRWRSSRSISGGVLYDWGVHFLEYALQLIDSEIVEVSGFETNGVWNDSLRWGDDTNEAEATAIVRFANGVLLSLRMTSIDTKERPQWFEITGTKGSYFFDGETWELVRPRSKSIVREKGKNPNAEYERFYDNIADCLTGKKELIITPEWARRPVHILDLAARSARAGRTLKAKYS